MFRPRIERFLEGTQPTVSRQMEPMRLAVMANANLGATGVRAMSGPTGAAVAVAQRTRIELFQLTEAVQWPDATRSGGDEDEADVPWSDGAKRLWLEPWKPRVASPEGNTYSVQDGTGYSADAREETIYWPLCFRNANGIGIGTSAVASGDTVQAAFNRQSGRWESMGHIGTTWRCELTESLAPGGNATANLLKWGGASYAADTDIEFEVYDPFSRFRQSSPPSGQDGARGYAVHCGDRNVWELIQLEHQARWIEFTVNDGSGFATTDASVTVDGIAYHGGYEPTTGITTVYNKAISSNYLFEGDDDDKGIAHYDPDDDKYYIWQMECP